MTTHRRSEQITRLVTCCVTNRTAASRGQRELQALAVVHGAQVYGFSRGVGNHHVTPDTISPEPLSTNGFKPVSVSHGGES